ncbi:MAG: hypothetical protein M1826_001407 [Phylliscum demangeonii]|nr:MAG: hypothetical protein M1826_001407 [Phylliscum demangeonii]
MIGAHTDSPSLRVKPISKKQGDGFMQVGVETYGGGLWHTWFDRDLSIAGRAMVRAKDGRIVQKLVKVTRPILRIPTLAIHLDRQETFSFNKETQLFPIAGLVAAELNRTGKNKENQKAEAGVDEDSKSRDEPIKPLRERHHPCLVEIIADAAEVAPEDLVDFEMLLYDTQAPVIGGMNNELILSARLDNLVMSYCSTMGLIESLSSEFALEDESCIRLVSLFDHEEIGSQTAQGADSNLLPAVIRRLSTLPLSSFPAAPGLGESRATASYEQCLASSFLISADMAHSVHPNYAAKYDSEHRPEMNQGVVIKINANARYATNSPGIVLLQEVARKARPAPGPRAQMQTQTQTQPDTDMDAWPGQGVPLQLFVVRNDSSCGSTIGPMLSAALGVRTLDLGNAQLSMHSIRETGGVYDVDYAIRLFESFFSHFSAENARIVVD